MNTTSDGLKNPANTMLPVNMNQTRNYDEEFQRGLEAITNIMVKWSIETKTHEKDLEKQLMEEKAQNAELQKQLLSLQTAKHESMKTEDARFAKLLARKEKYKKKFNNEHQLVVNLQSEMTEKDDTIASLRAELATKDTTIDDLQLELANKDKQLDKFQMENTLLLKQVDGFDGFFQVFLDKLKLVFSDFFAGSDCLLESDNAAIDNFIKNVVEHKKKIMDLKSDHHQQIFTHQSTTSDEQGDAEHSEDQLTRNALSTILINDKDLEREVETIVQSNDVDELSWFVCKLKGFLHAEQTKRRLFEAKGLHADTDELTSIANHVTQFAEDIIAESKEHTDISHPDLEQLQQSISKIYGELKDEQAFIKELEDKISPDEKKDALAILSEQCMCAVKKLCKRASEIQKGKPSTALELLYTGTGICLPACTSTVVIVKLWSKMIACYKMLEQYHKVIDLYTGVIEQMPEMPLFYYYRARAYYKLQQYDNAIVDVNKVLELKPDHNAAQELKSKIESNLHN